MTNVKENLKKKQRVNCPNKRCPATAGVTIVKDGNIVCCFCGSIIIIELKK